MIITREMSISADEFTRIIGRLGAQPVDDGVAEAASCWKLGGARISIRPLPPLRRGAITLPRVEMRLDASAISRLRAEMLLEDIRRAFQRAGG